MNSLPYEDWIPIKIIFNGYEADAWQDFKTGQTYITSEEVERINHLVRTNQL